MIVKAEVIKQSRILSVVDLGRVLNVFCDNIFSVEVNHKRLTLVSGLDSLNLDRTQDNVYNILKIVVYVEVVTEIIIFNYLEANLAVENIIVNVDPKIPDLVYTERNSLSF